MNHPQTALQKARLGSQASDRREMIAWAEPVIADRVGDSYRTAMPGGSYALGIMMRHRELWRSMLMGHSDTLPASRQELQRLGSTAGMPSDFFDTVDQQIMEELFEIVLARYHASRASVRRFGLILMSAAADLGAAQAAS